MFRMTRNDGVRRDEQGFTLLELMIAISILTVGLMAAASLQGTALRSDAYAYRNTTATSVAQQIMDDFLSRPIVYTQPPSGGYAFFTTAANNQIYDRFPPYDRTGHAPVRQYVVAGAGTYTATYSILPNTPTTNITQITVRIQMTTASGVVQPPFTFVGHREIPST